MLICTQVSKGHGRVDRASFFVQVWAERGSWDHSKSFKQVREAQCTAAWFSSKKYRDWGDRLTACSNGSKGKQLLLLHGMGAEGLPESFKNKVDHKGGPTEAGSNLPQTVQLEKWSNPSRKGLCAGHHPNTKGSGQWRKMHHLYQGKCKRKFLVGDSEESTWIAFPWLHNQ